MFTRLRLLADLRLPVVFGVFGVVDVFFQTIITYVFLAGACNELFPSKCSSAAVTARAAAEQRGLLASIRIIDIALLPVYGVAIDFLKRRAPTSPRARVPLLMWQLLGYTVRVVAVTVAWQQALPWRLVQRCAWVSFVASALMGSGNALWVTFFTLAADQVPSGEDAGKRLVQLELGYFIGRPIANSLVAHVLGGSSTLDAPGFAATRDARLLVALQLSSVGWGALVLLAAVVLLLFPSPLPPARAAGLAGLESSGHQLATQQGPPPEPAQPPHGIDSDEESTLKDPALSKAGAQFCAAGLSQFRQLASAIGVARAEFACVALVYMGVNAIHTMGDIYPIILQRLGWRPSQVGSFLSIWSGAGAGHYLLAPLVLTCISSSQILVIYTLAGALGYALLGTGVGIGVGALLWVSAFLTPAADTCFPLTRAICASLVPPSVTGSVMSLFGLLDGLSYTSGGFTLASIFTATAATIPSAVAWFAMAAMLLCAQLAYVALGLAGQRQHRAALQRTQPAGAALLM